MKKLGWFSVLFLMGATVAFAAQAAGAPASPTASLPAPVKGILNGLLAGVIAAGLGWIKNRNAANGDMEKFEIKYMIPTLVIGAIVGLISGWMGKTPQNLLESMETSPIYAGIVVVGEMIWKAIWRNSVPMVREALQAVKTGGGNPPTPPSNPS
jgi:hypothetical protein